MKFSEKIDQILPALFRARTAMSDTAKKNKENNHLHNRYADLSAYLDEILPELKANDLMLIQTPTPEGNDSLIMLETMLMHSSGQWMSEVMPMPLGQKTPHAFGSALTYARRYHLSALFGMSSADDDGQGTKKPVKEFLRAFELAETLEQLRDFFAEAHRTWEDEATRRVLTDAKDKAKRRIDTPVAGFNPAARPKAQPNRQEPEQDQTQEAGDFAQF